MTLTRVLCLGLLVVASTAAAANEQATEATPSTAAPAAAASPAASSPAAMSESTAAPAATATSKQATSAAMPDSAEALGPEQLKRLTRGYKRAKRGEQELWCKDEMPLGSRLPERKCYTLQALLDQERIRQQNRQYIERKQVERPLQGL